MPRPGTRSRRGEPFGKRLSFEPASKPGVSHVNPLIVAFSRAMSPLCGSSHQLSTCYLTSFATRTIWPRQLVPAETDSRLGGH